LMWTEGLYPEFLILMWEFQRTVKWMASFVHLRG